MKKRESSAACQGELELTIGLVWGHLCSRQFEAAYELARGCLWVWPDEPRLGAMMAYAQLELFDDPSLLTALRQSHARYGRWGALMLHRADREARRHAQ